MLFQIQSEDTCSHTTCSSVFLALTLMQVLAASLPTDAYLQRDVCILTCCRLLNLPQSVAHVVMVNVKSSERNDMKDTIASYSLLYFFNTTYVYKSQYTKNHMPVVLYVKFLVLKHASLCARSIVRSQPGDQASASADS